MKKLLWALMAFSCAACGEVRDLEQRIQSWRDSRPLQQRYEKCQEEAGDWVAHITIAACENGRTQVQVQADPNDTATVALTMACLKGTGGEYTDQCTHTDAESRLYWNDGPSTPEMAQAVSGFFGDEANQINWNELFWAAARNHDYCYHSGVSRGLNKDDCDNAFYAHMKAVCTQPQSRDNAWFTADRCYTMADGMYHAVRTEGDTAYDMTGTVVDYPEWRIPAESPSSA